MFLVFKVYSLPEVSGTEKEVLAQRRHSADLRTVWFLVGSIQNTRQTGHCAQMSAGQMRLTYVVEAAGRQAFR